MLVTDSSFFLTFYYSACHVCKTDSETKLCSGCKLVSYCSKSHQSRDWQRHKDLCKCVQVIMKEWQVSNIFGLESKSVLEWRQVRLALICLVEERLCRLMRSDEKQMFFFPKVCKECFRADVTNTYSCQNCKQSHYCSSEHMNDNIFKHLNYCSEMKSAFTVDKKCFLEQVNHSAFILELGPFYSKGILEKKDFPSDTMEFMKKFCGFSNLDHILLSESVSAPLSVIYGIFSSLVLPKSVYCLNMHVIGANMYELNLIKYIEVIFHFIPTLKVLSVVVIGPDAEDVFDEPTLCGLCSEKKLHISKQKNFYHELIESDTFVPPDIIVAFNCGFSEFQGTSNDTWKESIKSFLRLSNTMLLFTSYTEEEGLKDLARLKEFTSNRMKNFDCIIENSENPFKSLRPQRNWEENEIPIFYFNNYISIVDIYELRYQR